MFYKLTINLKLLQNDEILPKTIQDGILFYEIVIKNGCDVISRIPFKNEDKWKIELYDNETEIPSNRIIYSMTPNIIRFDESKCLTFHAIKIIHDVDSDGDEPLITRIGYETHIKESTSEIQDLPFFTLEKSIKKIPVYFEDFKLFTNTEPLKQIVELPLHDKSFKSQYWLTQRAFYSTTHVTLSDNVHRENIQLIRDFFEKYIKYEFTSILEMLIRFARVMTKNRIKYKVDTKFAQYLVSTDAGDIQIETSVFSDCEDHGHFYMRVFRTFSTVYKYFLTDENSDIFRKCNEFSENYIPFNFICQVKLNSGLEFHSTMMIIPVTIKYPTISFEVTNPKKSYMLPAKEFHEWHNEQYFLVDNYFICKILKVPLDKVSIHDLKCINY